MIVWPNYDPESIMFNNRWHIDSSRLSLTCRLGFCKIQAQNLVTYNIPPTPAKISVLSAFNSAIETILLSSNSPHLITHPPIAPESWENDRLSHMFV